MKSSIRILLILSTHRVVRGVQRRHETLEFVMVYELSLDRWAVGHEQKGPAAQYLQAVAAAMSVPIENKGMEQYYS